RLAILAAAVALYLGANGNGWVQDWWDSSPLPWAFAPHQLSLLTVVIPGTIAGDLVLRWMRAGTSTAVSGAWSRERVTWLAVLAAIFTPIVVVGMYTRYVQFTTQVVASILVAGMFLVRSPSTPTEKLLRSLFLLGAAWLMIGLFLEPSEGG